MKKFLNYIGQIRIYSLVDLVLMLIAAGVRPFSVPFRGAVWLWLGFLVYLEHVHKDKGRAVPLEVLPWLMWLAAVRALKVGDVAAALYIPFSILYAKKKQRPWGRLSPFVRGLQTATMLLGISEHTLTWQWLAAVVTASTLVTARNFLGDARDTSQDKAENMDTWAVAFKTKDHPFAHLFCVLGTTLVWWLYAGNLSVSLLFLVWTVEVATYWLTPRASNEKAFAEMRRLRSRLGFH